MSPAASRATDSATKAGCVFCQIVAGEISATVVHDDAAVIAFADLNPQAPVHVLVVPKRHFADVGELAADAAASAALVAGIGAVTRKLGLRSHRTVFNTGPESGQTVFHVHAHILSGRSLGWPPG